MDKIGRWKIMMMEIILFSKSKWNLKKNHFKRKVNGYCFCLLLFLFLTWVEELCYHAGLWYYVSSECHYNMWLFSYLSNMQPLCLMYCVLGIEKIARHFFQISKSPQFRLTSCFKLGCYCNHLSESGGEVVYKSTDAQVTT